MRLFAKAWKEATAETSAENAVARSKEETEALHEKGLVEGADLQVRRNIREETFTHSSRKLITNSSNPLDSN